jgi:hypothetical protein
LYTCAHVRIHLCMHVCGAAPPFYSKACEKEGNATLVGLGIWRTMASAGRAVQESEKDGGMKGHEARGAESGWEGWAFSPSSLPDSIQSIPPLLAYLCTHTHIARWREKQIMRGILPKQIRLALAHLSAVMLPLCPSSVLVCPSAGPAMRQGNREKKRSVCGRVGL